MTSMEERRQNHVDIVERIVTLETQMKRLVSDAESEKDTRRRSNASMFERFTELNDKIFKINRTIWVATGVVGTMIFALNFLGKHT